MGFSVPGIRFHTTDMIALLPRLKELGEWMGEETKRLVMEQLVKDTIALVDDCAGRGMDIPKSPMAQAYDKFNQKVEEARKGWLTPGYDFDFSLVLIPFEDSLYGTCHTTRSDWRARMCELSIAERWHYHDGDPEDADLPKDWPERTRVWRTIFADGGPPKDRGYTWEFKPQMALFIPTRDRLIKKLGEVPRGERAMRVAKDVVSGERYAARISPNDRWDIGLITKIDHEMKTPEGQKEIESRAVEIALLLPELNEDTLK